MNIMKFTGNAFEAANTLVAALPKAANVLNAAIDNFAENQETDHLISKVEKLKEFNDACTGLKVSDIISTAQTNKTAIESALAELSTVANK